MGLAADSVETASNTPMFLMILPFISSGFVPTAAMPVGLRQFAEYQPFTPMIDTLRALLTGVPTGADLWLAIGWCALIALVGFLWSRRLFLRVPTR
jgi:ABC-2 type transport system permease protein